jgi:hypothetical protein
MRGLNQIPRVPLRRRREWVSPGRVRLFVCLSAARTLLLVNARFRRRRAGRETGSLSHPFKPLCIRAPQRSASPHMGGLVFERNGTSKQNRVGNMPQHTICCPWGDLAGT